MKNFTHTDYKILRPSIKTRGTTFSEGGFKRGFTIVETLVAIAILMISVAGPLVVASKGLTAALVSKDQMIASYLAQDTMETIKNVKDNNVANSVSWLNGLNYNAGSTCDSDALGCDINGVDGVVLSGSCSSIPCRIPIYYNNATGYTHVSNNASQTIFYRHYYIENNNYISSSKSEMRVHVIVDWNEGTVPYQIELMSELIDITR